MKFFLLILIIPVFSWAQDETLFKEFFSLETSESKEKISDSYHWKIPSTIYKYDLDDDNFPEEFQTMNIDGIDWLFIRKNGETIFEKPLDTIGTKSRVYKLKIVDISNEYKAVLVFYYQGHYQGKNFFGSSQLYFLSFLKKNITKAKFTKGPRIFTEFEHKSGYIINEKDILIKDLNWDKKRDIIVYQGRMNQVYTLKDGAMVEINPL